MSIFYTIDTANARVPDIRAILLLLREQRDELIRLRDRLVELGVDEAPLSSLQPSRPQPDGAAAPDAAADAADTASDRPAAPPAVAPHEEARLIRLRMQGVIDQMQASVARLDGWSITLRDIDSGLIDFPALASGRQIWLCWRLGEGDIDWWHRVDEGYAGRRRLADLI